MEIEPIIKNQKRMRIGEYLKATWYFEKPYEKIILVVLGILGLLKIWDWIF